MKSTAFRRITITLAIQFIIVIAFAQPTTWAPRGIGGGGSMFYPSINPLNDNEFYVACDMSQLFHSTDFGATYSMVPFTKMQVGNMSVYEFTSNNNTAYCIANDGNINFGVRTLDGGNTWTALPGSPFPGDDVYALKADHANPNRIIIGFYNSIYISQNAGNSFTLVRNAANTGAGITIAGVFFDGNNIYIGTNEGILFSSNGGSSFAFLATTGMPATQAIFSFAGAKSGATTRFFCVTADPADIYNGLPPWDYWGLVRGVYSLDVGANAWTSQLTGININTDFVMYVAMARNDINTVYLGGSDDNTGGNLVMKTTNAGGNWTKVFLTTNNQNIRTGWSGAGGDRGWGYGESCFGITVAPNNANKVLFGDYGFVHKTSDGGATWQQAYVSTADEHPAGSNTPQDRSYHSIGLENTTCWQVHWQDANNMFACYSDINGIRSTDAGVTWSYDYTGHTINTMYRIAKHQTLNRMFAGTSGIHDMYQSTRLQDNPLDNNDAGGRIIYSDNNGASWQLLHQFNHPVFWVATDPTNPNRMYASVIHYGAGTGQGGIWVTNDLNNLGSSNWVQLPEPVSRLEGHPASIAVLNDGTMVCTYSGRRNGAGTFTTSSGVFRYNPTTGIWTDVTHADMQYWTKDIVIDPSDPTQNTWYVCVFSGWGGAPNGRGGLFRTTDRGNSWTKLTGSQFDRVTSITFNPLIPTQAYLTTEVQGLWISNNMSAATPTWTLVDNYPFRQPERVYFNPYNSNEIWVSSFGNGMKMGLQSMVLPLKLITFSGNRTATGIALKWTTANEDPGDHFEIQRSRDGLQFETITTINGNGRLSNSYDFNETITGTRLYYRIKVISGSGSVFYSHTLAFNQTNELYTEIRMLGNPVKNSTMVLEATMPVAGVLNLNMVDVSGKNILQQQMNVNEGINQLNIVLPAGCSNGIYILRVETGSVKRSLRVLVAR